MSQNNPWMAFNSRDKTTKRNINMIFIEINFMTSCRFLCIFSPILSSLDGFHGNDPYLLCQVIKMFQVLHFNVISALEKNHRNPHLDYNVIMKVVGSDGS